MSAHNVFSDKVIVTNMLKYLSPISLYVLKRAIPSFYRCGVIQSIQFIHFFQKKLLSNLRYYFDGDEDLALLIFQQLKESKKHSYILTGSFVLNTLTGDDVKTRSRDIDIVHIGNRCNCYGVSGYTVRNDEESDNEDNIDLDENDTSLINALTNSGYINAENSYQYRPGHKYIQLIENIDFNVNESKKRIQILDVGASDFETYVDGFDLDICKNYYNGNTVRVKKIRNIVKRSFTIYIDNFYIERISTYTPFNILDLCDSIFTRLLKYMQRDYDINIASTDIITLKQKSKGIFMNSNDCDFDIKREIKEAVECYFPEADSDNATEFIRYYSNSQLFHTYAYTWTCFWGRRIKDGQIVLPKVQTNY